MWNFSGRQNDVQGHGRADRDMLLHGNWMTGIDLIDSEHVGNQAKVPSTISSNPGYNKYFLIPLILGLIGFIFQLIKAPKDWFVVFLLFLFTGFAIIIYLNQKPFEPRERDYAYAASFYAFAFWIGMSVYALYNIAKTVTLNEVLKVLGISAGTGVMVYLIELGAGNSHTFSYSLLFITAIGGAMCLAMVFIGKSKNELMAAVLAVLFCLPAPILLATENWDDHDRSNRFLARDMAITYLESCEPNAILFSVGDNDTFPLWYVQEVEGVRTDVRVVNLSLLGADWHANQAKMKAYDSDPLPLSLEEPNFRSGTRDAMFVGEHRLKNKFFNAKEIIKLVKENKDGYSNPQVPQVKQKLPANKYYITVNKENCLKYGIVDPKDKDKMEDTLKWTVGSNVMYRPDLILLDLLAHFNWERPIYFTSPSMGEHKGLNKYLTADGLVHRFTPIANEQIDVEETYNHIMNDFKWGNLNDDGVLIDYYFTRQIGWLRRISLVTAQELAQRKDTARAIEILDKCMLELPLKNVPADESTQNMALIYFELGEIEKGLELLNASIKADTEMLEYVLSFEEEEQMMQLYTISEKAEQLGVMLPRVIRTFDLEDSLMDKFGTNAALDKLRVFTEKYLRMSSGEDARQVLGAVPSQLIREWHPELFEK